MDSRVPQVAYNAHDSEQGMASARPEASVRRRASVATNDFRDQLRQQLDREEGAEHGIAQAAADLSHTRTTNHTCAAEQLFHAASIVRTDSIRRRLSLFQSCFVKPPVHGYVYKGDQLWHLLHVKRLALNQYLSLWVLQGPSAFHRVPSMGTKWRQVPKTGRPSWGSSPCTLWHA